MTCGFLSGKFFVNGSCHLEEWRVLRHCGAGRVRFVCLAVLCGWACSIHVSCGTVGLGVFDSCVLRHCGAGRVRFVCLAVLWGWACSIRVSCGTVGLGVFDSCCSEGVAWLMHL